MSTIGPNKMSLWVKMIEQNIFVIKVLTMLVRTCDRNAIEKNIEKIGISNIFYIPRCIANK